MAFVIAFTALANVPSQLPPPAASKVEFLASDNQGGSCGSITPCLHHVLCSQTSACAGCVAILTSASALGVQVSCVWSIALTVAYAGQRLAPGIRPPIDLSNA